MNEITARHIKDSLNGLARRSAELAEFATKWEHMLADGDCDYLIHLMAKLNALSAEMDSEERWVEHVVFSEVLKKPLKEV